MRSPSKTVHTHLRNVSQHKALHRTLRTTDSTLVNSGASAHLLLVDGAARADDEGIEAARVHGILHVSERLARQQHGQHREEALAHEGQRGGHVPREQRERVDERRTQAECKEVRCVKDV